MVSATGQSGRSEMITGTRRQWMAQIVEMPMPRRSQSRVERVDLFKCGGVNGD